MATYAVAPTGPIGLRGDDAWRVLVDGEQRDGFIFDTPERAELIAGRYRERDRLDELVDAAIGQEYHYGIRVWAELQAGRSLPVWRVADQYRNYVDYAFAHYSATPPAVNVYTREQYETACSAVGLTAEADDVLGDYVDEFGRFDYHTYDALTVLRYALRGRRLQGLKREGAAVAVERADRLTAAGLDDGPYTRAEYEQACSITGQPALPDATLLAIVEQELVRLSGSGLLDVTLPADATAVALARRRVAALEQEAAADRRCDECGGVIVGSGMVASLGRACKIACFDAMADRPGRYASQAGRR